MRIQSELYAAGIIQGSIAEPKRFQYFRGNISLVLVATHPFFQCLGILVFSGRQIENLHHLVEGTCRLNDSLEDAGVSEKSAFRADRQFAPPRGVTSCYEGGGDIPMPRTGESPPRECGQPGSSSDFPRKVRSSPVFRNSTKYW
jgi:hypothetical protein